MIYHVNQSNIAFMNKKYLNKNFYRGPVIIKMPISVRQIGNEKLRYNRKGRSKN